MLPGLVVGESATVEDTVQSNMQAEFGGQVIHSVYGTEHVVCDVDVRQGSRLLGEGRVNQRIIPKAMLHERFPEMWGPIE